MTDSNYTHVVVIRDRSGSMADLAADMDGGLATYLDEQSKQPGRATLSLYDFDTEFEIVCAMVSVGANQVRPLVARGNTALLDAVGKAITMEGDRLASLTEDQRPAHVLVQIITDGEENASREWTKDQVRDLITQQERDYGWVVAFLGTRIDAFAEARGIGIHASRVHDFAPTAQGVKSTYATASAATSSLRSGGTYVFVNDQE